MKKVQIKNHRRGFLKKCGLSTLPFLLPVSASSSIKYLVHHNRDKVKPPINFIFDGLAMSPNDYLIKLQEVNSFKRIEPDFYGNGGVGR